MWKRNGNWGGIKEEEKEEQREVMKRKVWDVRWMYSKGEKREGQSRGMRSEREELAGQDWEMRGRKAWGGEGGPLYLISYGIKGFSAAFSGILI